MLLHARNLFLLLTFSFLAACGGGGGGGGGTVTTPAVQQGTLALAITGLPAATAALVRVTGPGGYSQQIGATQTLSSLSPGSYTVTADPVVSGTVSYTPTPVSQSITVAAGAAATATVAYSSVAFKLALREIANVSGAVFASAPAGDARLFIVERAGRIRVMQGDAMLAAPFLDIANRVSTQGEGGLLSVAFHPQNASNGLFFVYYTDLGNNIVVERFHVSANANVADAGSALQIIRIAHPTYTNHFGGLVAFGPDGMLYLATGDGGGAGDPAGNAQNTASLLGKMLRLDVSASSLVQPYAIPATNPWFNDNSGRRPEIWAYGLRNPWRFAFDAGNLYIADVGQDRREEVNVALSTQGGLNYGWDTMEGSLCYNATSCAQVGLTLPVFEYDHGSNDANGCSITGGYVYRGSALPELAGRYFYSDYCKGFLKSLTYAGGTATAQAEWPISDIGNVVSFGRDGAGELLVITAGGKVYRMIRG